MTIWNVNLMCLKSSSIHTNAFHAPNRTMLLYKVKHSGFSWFMGGLDFACCPPKGLPSVDVSLCRACCNKLWLHSAQRRYLLQSFLGNDNFKCQLLFLQVFKYASEHIPCVKSDYTPIYNQKNVLPIYEGGLDFAVFDSLYVYNIYIYIYIDIDR